MPRREPGAEPQIETRNRPVATIISHSAEETAAFGRSWRSRRSGTSDVLALCGDLGAGQNPFCKGARRGGLDAGDVVTSPTFT